MSTRTLHGTIEQIEHPASTDSAPRQVLYALAQNGFRIMHYVDGTDTQRLTDLATLPDDLAADVLRLVKLVIARNIH